MTVDNLTGRIVGSALGMIDILAVALGDRLGWYRALAGDPATAAQLAERTGTDARYALEWLEQQAVTGFLETTDEPDAERRVYTLPPASERAFTEDLSTGYLAPMARMLTSAAGQLPTLAEAYRSGEGLSWAAQGEDVRDAKADTSRPWFVRKLPPVLAEVDWLHATLGRPGARALDVGCGTGWSGIGLAQAYPDLRVDGVDLDEPSVDIARRNTEDAGLTERVTVEHRDAAELPESTYDVAFAFECVHDLPRPVEVLAAVRRTLAPGGSLVVMDEAVADTFTAPGDSTDRLMYGFSLLMCLPDSRSSLPSVATGTVMRAETMRAYAEQAGFTSTEVMPIDGFGLWRFYRLTG